MRSVWLHEDFLLSSLIVEGFKRPENAQKFSEADKSSNEEEGQLSVTGLIKLGSENSVY